MPQSGDHIWKNVPIRVKVRQEAGHRIFNSIDQLHATNKVVILVADLCSKRAEFTGQSTDSEHPHVVTLEFEGDREDPKTENDAAEIDLLFPDNISDMLKVSVARTNKWQIVIAIWLDGVDVRDQALRIFDRTDEE